MLIAEFGTTTATDPRGSALLLDAARVGDEQAWGELVSRHTGLLWSVARSYGLGRAAAEEVLRTVWLRLLECGHVIREPSSVPEWLIASARRECLAAVADPGAGDDPPAGPGPDSAADHPLWQAFRQLPERDARLLALLAGGATYDEAAAVLRMPRDSIEPTRTRALHDLRGGLPREQGDGGSGDPLRG